MEILAFLATIVVGFIAEAYVTPALNWPGAGAIFATAAMGSFLLWAIRHPNRKE